MSKARLLLFHNTPKAKTYFRRLQTGLQGLDVHLRPTGLGFGQPWLSRDEAELVAYYSLLRKRCRPHLRGRRLRLNEWLYRRAANWHYTYAREQIESVQPDLVGVWSGNAVDVSACRAAARDLGLRTALFEIGLLPGTTTCDIAGVNHASSVPRDPAFYAGYPVSNATRLPNRLSPRKPHVTRRRLAPIALPERYFFVPFQVALDSQILLHSPWVRSMDSLFEFMVRALADCNRMRTDSERVALVFKRHPSCSRSYSELRADAEGLRDVHFADGNDTEALIRNSLGVVTINSSVGIEAMLFDKPVLTLGDAVYSVAGVTDRAASVEGIAYWMDGQLDNPVANAWPHRDAFLRYLANDYCIPGSHRAPSSDHFARLQSLCLEWIGVRAGSVLAEPGMDPCEPAPDWREMTV